MNGQHLLKVDLFLAYINDVLALTPCQIWALERRIFHQIMISTAKTKHRERLEQMKHSRLNQIFNEEQMKTLSDSVSEQHFQFRCEIHGEDLEGKIFLIVNGKVS